VTTPKPPPKPPTNPLLPRYNLMTYESADLRERREQLCRELREVPQHKKLTQ